MANEKVEAVEEGELVDDESETSIEIQLIMNPTLRLNDDERRKRRIASQLQQNYVFSYIINQASCCPASRCNNYTASRDIVPHLLNSHETIPRFMIELETHYEIPLDLHQLEYGMNIIIAVMLFPIIRGTVMPSDRSTMPLVVLAAKLHPYGNLEYIESHMTPTNSEAEDKLLNDVDLLMIWVCGNVKAVRTELKLSNDFETERYVYSGYIHHIAENNHHPHKVFDRGNCLFVPARYITNITDNGRVPLDLSIRFLAEEEELL